MHRTSMGFMEDPSLLSSQSPCTLDDRKEYSWDEPMSPGPSLPDFDSIGSSWSLDQHWNSAVASEELELFREPSEEAIALITQLTAAFQDVGQYRRLLCCRDSQAQKLIDLFQILLDTPRLDNGFRRSLVVVMQRLSRRAGLYPTCYNLTDIKLMSDHPVAAGSFADIYKGHFLGQPVCLKVIRIYQASRVDYFLKQFSQEAILWGQLLHPNLLPIYGLYRYNSRLCFVSPWMDNGDLSSYLEHNEGIERTLLALDVASGLAYLHSNGIIHGDLKGANILVTKSGRACLADFGLSSISDSNILKWTSHSSAASTGGSVRWQAPELFDVDNDEVVHNSTTSDVYAWSCVCYELFVGTIPFAEVVRDTTVMLKIRLGSRPSRPPVSSASWAVWGLTEDIWSLMQDCWKEVPGERPSIEDAIARLAPNAPRDCRPVDSGNSISPARFRDSISGRFDTLSVRDLEDILSSSKPAKPRTGVIS